MSLCPNGDSPIIEWQYPGEEKNRIIGATNYKVEYEGGKYGTLTNYVYTFSWEATVTHYTPNPVKYPDLPTIYVPGQKVLLSCLVTFDGFIYNVWTTNNNNNRNIVIEYLARSGGNSTTGYCERRAIELPLLDGSGQRVRAVPESLKAPVVGSVVEEENVKFTIVPGRTPRTCIIPVEAGYKFSIYKNDKVVYQKTRSVPPEVNHYCQNDALLHCPPGTCECTNGSTVCCYDPNTGIAVKSFTR